MIPKRAYRRLSPKIWRNLYRILPFAVVWFIFGSLYLLIEKGILGDANYYPSTGNSYDFEGTIFTSLISIIITGFIVGSIEILYLEKLFKAQSLARKIILKSLIYILILVIFLVVTSLIDQSIELDVSPFDSRALTSVWNFVFSFAFLSIAIYISFLILITLFYSEVSQNLGLNVFYNFFTGKYHRPTIEERIFMFLDMKSSTAFAEKLGHVKYFEMLQEYYADLSDPIIAHAGEIYQYVGDEIIITWKPKNGLSHANCLHCFFEMHATLRKQQQKYAQKFGAIPTFKAGIHYGQVTTGEIGVIKKDIIFTGDVLNTAARIQGLCNELGVDVLISADFLQHLDLREDFEVLSMGTKDLRGRNEPIELWTVKVRH